MTKPLFLLILVALLAACDSGRTVRELGIIDFYGDSDEVILAPETVQVGKAFPVVIQTYNRGCWQADEMDITVEDSLAVLKPYDLVVVDDTPCPLREERLLHSAQLTFEEVGPATIRVEGRSEDSSVTGGAGGQAVVEKTITVE